ncbi:hypothetical protein KJ359_008539 [Pestalotiopsis sp. 9143b]|nr:hypothetical protein KJ359_008539 [Pestalotiopsis sp. 9143b]
MPFVKPYLRFHEWSKQYGEVVGLKIGTGNLVLLNTPDLVHELFDKRGAICSNRPVNHILTKYVHSEPEEKGIAILQYDDYYRRWRKSFQFILGAAGIKRLLPLLEAEASSLCQKFLDGSKDYEQCCRHWALAVPLVATTGERLGDKPSNYADNVLHAQEELLSLILPGAAPPVDVLPFLKYIPEVLASWKSRARAVRKYMVDDASEYLIGAKKTYKQITENPASVGFDSLLPKIMEEQANGNTKEHFTDTELAYIGQAAVGAAVDTTLATFKSLMIAFAAFPEKLAKAQEEIDRVASDGPLSGSRIGTMLIANAWTIHRNEEEYDRPDEFIPERFMDNEFGLRPGYKAGSGRRALYAFGSGRRQCPGEDFAVTAVLLAASKVIWACDITPPSGGVDYSIETGYKDGTVTQPVRPEVLFTPRSREKEAAVQVDAERTESIARALLG